MDPSRKRRIRLTVALSTAVLLAVGLVWTSFSAGSEAKTPAQLIADAKPGQRYQLTGKVVKGSIQDIPGGKSFEVRELKGTAKVPVRYLGSVPDTFRADREVIVTVRKEGTAYAGEKDSLVTKCPSKFEEQEKKTS